MKSDMLELSVVVPAYNEAEGITEFHRRMTSVIVQMGMRAEILYVNDGSRDETLARLLALREISPYVAVVNLSRNFGKEIALAAGLDYARGNAVVVIDADLQDPPELIPKLVEKWREGFDVVYAKRTSRQGESWLKKVTASVFYRVMQRVGRVTIPPDTGDFRLLSRRAVDALVTLREQHRFMKGLFAWVGYPQTAVEYARDPRFAGTTKWNYWRLWNLAIEGFTSFSIAPLKLATYVGVLTSAVAFIYGMVILVRTLAFGRDVPGYPSLMVVILFLGGMQLLALGVVGEYLGRVFDEVKQRPLYFMQDYLEARPPITAPEAAGTPSARTEIS